MGKTPSRRFLARVTLSNTATALMGQLRDNDWPLPFEPPPHVDDWQSVAQKKGDDAPEVTLMLKERKSVLECHSGWTCLLHVFIHGCRSYLNDFAGPVEKRRFEVAG